MEHKVFGEEELIRQKAQRLLDAYSLGELLEIHGYEDTEVLVYLIESGMVDFDELDVDDD